MIDRSKFEGNIFLAVCVRPAAPLSFVRQGMPSNLKRSEIRLSGAGTHGPDVIQILEAVTGELHGNFTEHQNAAS